MNYNLRSAILSAFFSGIGLGLLASAHRPEQYFVYGLQVLVMGYMCLRRAREVAQNAD